MKPIFGILTVLAFSISMVSCTKNYECVCYRDGEKTYSYTISDTHDKGATEQCDDKQATLFNNECGIE